MSKAVYVRSLPCWPLLVLVAALLQTAPVRAEDKAANKSRRGAIRAAADAFVKAFNAGDAKAIGALWAPDAEYTDESGKTFQGREAIEKEYAELFKEHPGAAMTVTIESIRFLGTDAAIEKGIAKVNSPRLEGMSGARYTVVHAKKDGAWSMVLARDEAYEPESNEDHLKGLEWLIGDWKLDAKGQPLTIRFEWLAQKNFIKNTYVVTKDGQATLTGGQIIGWNPKLGRIVSWHFDANGGFGTDVWAKDGSKWAIQASGVLRDGSESSSVNLLTPVDANSFTWQSVNRHFNGTSIPDLPVSKVVRVQPEK